MQTAADPFKPLLNVIERYRNDVHNLRDPATSDALEAAKQVLTQPIPRSLLRFLHRWNGAVLFRGVLQIRSVTELAPASEHVQSVIVFADGPLETDHWAYAPNADNDAVFGRWTGSTFEPLHTSFEAWLAATIHILDNNIREPAARFEARAEIDPESSFLLMRRGDAAMETETRDRHRAVQKCHHKPSWPGRRMAAARRRESPSRPWTSALGLAQGAPRYPPSPAGSHRDPAYGIAHPHARIALSSSG